MFSIRKAKIFRGAIAAGVSLIFFGQTVFTPVVSAQTPAGTMAPLLGLPLPGHMVPVSDGFAPVLVRGLKLDPANPFTFDFIIDPGDFGPAGSGIINTR